MGEKLEKKPASIVGWLWLSVAAVAAMAGRRMTDSADGTWRWVVLGLAGLTLVKVVFLLRATTTSGWRLGGMLAWVGMAGALGIIGIPSEWLNVPDMAQLGAVFFPLLLLMVAVLAALIGIARWNHHREMEGPSQHTRLAVVLNAVIAVVAWQVIRQPLWKESVAGLLQLPQIYENRLALEEGVRQWTEMMGDNGGGVAAGASPTTAGRATSRRVYSISAVGRRLAAIQGDRNAPAAVRTRARFLQEMGCHADAAAELMPLVQSLQGDDNDVRECMRSLALSHQIGHARELAERLMVRGPSRELQRWLAILDAEIGEVDRAMAALRQLARRRPFDPADSYFLGETANLVGRPSDALVAVSYLEGAGHRSERTRLIGQRARTALAVRGLPRDNVLVAK